MSDDNRTDIDNVISKLKVNLNDFEKERRGDALLKTIMRKWCPISNCLLPLVVTHFPSPIAAQSYRFNVLYKGSDPAIVDAIKSGQGSGQFVMKIVKTLQTNDHGRRYAFGRVLSGTLRKGHKVKVITPEEIFHKKVDFERAENVEEKS